MVLSGGSFSVSFNGSATAITALKGADLLVGVAPDTYAKGTYNGSVFEFSGAVLSGYSVRSGLDICVFSGGTATVALGSANWSGWEIRAIGDFSNDGKDDIVLFHEETGSMVMCANGNLDSYVSIGQLAPKDWFVVGAGDYNGDAKDDLLVRQHSTGMLGYYSGGDTSKWVEMGRGVDMKWTVIE